MRRRISCLALRRSAIIIIIPLKFHNSPTAILTVLTKEHKESLPQSAHYIILTKNAMSWNVNYPRALLNVDIVGDPVAAHSPHFDLWTLHGDSDHLVSSL